MLTELATSPDELKQEVEPIVSWARSLEIANQEDFEAAGQQLMGIKGMAKRIADFFQPMKKAADEAKKKILDQERSMSAPLAEAEALAKSKILAYQRQEQERAEAERRRLQAIADEEARKAREKAEQEAARQRAAEAEARAKAEQARSEADTASAAERKKLLAQAEAAERKAAAAAVKAEEKSEQAAASFAPAVHVQTSAPRVTGLATSKIWKAEVIDANLVPREFLLVDEKRLDKFAKAMKEQAKVPGVRFYAQEVLSAKAAR